MKSTMDNPMVRVMAGGRYDFEKAMRIFKKKVQNTKIFSQLKMRKNNPYVQGRRRAKAVKARKRLDGNVN